MARRGGPMAEGAFAGVRVVELAQWVFVPVAGALLADWGADVARLGLDAETLTERYPSLIYARGHGYGVRGPDADRPGYDASAFWARGGLAHVLTPPDRDQPITQRGAMGDRNGAMALAFGIAGALLKRERTGEGSVVDVSLLATAMWTLSSDVLAALQGESPSAPAGRVLVNPL